MHKTTRATALTASMALMLVACGGGDSSGDGAANNDADVDTITIRIGHISTEEGSYEPILLEMDEALREATDGRVEIETYPNGQLGGDVEMLEQVQSGNLEATVINSAAASSVVPMVAGLELPYLFEDYEHAHSALDGEVGEFLTAEFDDAGLRLLAFWEVGFKNLTNDLRPIESADDAAGLQLRVIESPLSISTYSALGIDPTPLPFPEVYTALQQGVVDGFEGPYNSFVSGGLYEVQDYVSEIEMVYSSASFIIDPGVFDSLTEDDQQALLEIVDEYTQLQREHTHEIMARDKAAVQEAGVEVLETDSLDIESFREATANVIEESPEYADLVDVVE